MALTRQVQCEACLHYSICQKAECPDCVRHDLEPDWEHQSHCVDETTGKVWEYNDVFQFEDRDYWSFMDEMGVEVWPSTYRFDDAGCVKLLQEMQERTNALTGDETNQYYFGEITRAIKEITMEGKGVIIVSV